MRLNRSGVSLIELIMVMTVGSILGLIIYMQLSQGVRIWRYGAKEKPELEIALFAEKLKEELMNIVMDPKIMLVGQKNSIRFLSQGNEIVADEKTRLPRRVGYEYDPYRKVVLKSESHFHELLSGKESGREKIVLKNISEFDWEYYYYDGRIEEYRWKNLWNMNCLPTSIKLVVGDKNLKSKQLVYYFKLPMAEVCA